MCMYNIELVGKTNLYVREFCSKPRLESQTKGNSCLSNPLREGGKGIKLAQPVRVETLYCYATEEQPIISSHIRCSKNYK